MPPGSTARTMKEIRLHGRGGHGTVKAAEIIVHTAVSAGLYASSIPFFGFERRGAPVSAFVRIDTVPIRPKTQVYEPDCVVVMDATLLRAVDVFHGLRAGGILVVNARDPSQIAIPTGVSRIGSVDATGLSLGVLGKAVPNTVMLGAFARTTGWVDVQLMLRRIGHVFGKANAEAARAGYDGTSVIEIAEAIVGGETR